MANARLGGLEAPVIQALRDAGPERAVGWIGLDVPLELIDAAGLEPLQVVADPAKPSAAADPYAEGVGHPLLRALAGEVMELADAGLERLLVSTTPARDFSLYAFLVSLQRAGAALQRTRIIAVDVLHGDSPAAQAHTRALFQRLSSELTGGMGIGEAALESSIARRNQIRSRLWALEAHRRARRLGGVEALALHMEGARLPADVWLERLETGLASLAGRPALPGRPVIVSGPAETAPGTYRGYEAAGLLVVGDDHDAGSRAIGPQVAETGDPLDALTERYRARTPAPSGWSTSSATSALLALVERQGAEAVAFDIPFYDHSAAWDLPKKQAALAASGIDWTLGPPDAFRDPEASARLAADTLALRPSFEPVHD